MLKLLQKVFGSKHDKDVKALLPVVEEINSIFATLSTKSDDELRSRVDELRADVQGTIADLVAESEEIRQRLRTDAELDHDERSDLYARLAVIDKEEYRVMQERLNELLPEAFAIVKETCRRLVGHRYNVVGNEVTWDMVPYDVQLIGGIVLHQGKIAEMATGEGKTLVATLPLFLNSLTGRGVHLVTVNDYLAERDRAWMRPIFDMLGVTTGCIKSNLQPTSRQTEYHCDITYGTNNEFGFDYLRDNMANDAGEMVQRRHWFAIVDEVDSVLIDEARTPLIISGPVTTGSTDQAFVNMKPRVQRLVDAQSRFVNSIVAEAESLLKSSTKDDREKAGINLLRAYRGFPKHARLSKILQDPDALKLMRETELSYLKEQGTRMSIIDEELFYTVEEKNHQVDISEKGRELLSSANEDVDLFIIPDVGMELSAIENDESLDAESKQLRKDELMRRFADRSDRIHIVNQLLRAYSLYVRDDEYVVQDGKIKIVDEFTGRILEGRRYSDGLHQAIEAKENVNVEQDTQTWATITLQNYFRLYHKLAGMTGTAETEAGEFFEIYKLDVVVIPTNRSIQRKDLDDFIFRTKREKYNSLVEAVRQYVSEGRAVLVGTTSVEVSELLSKMLTRAKIQHNVLNAKQHQREAEIVSHAGRKGAVTIATNMAGRGTDIKLDPEVKANGGLAIIGTERHESRRIDRQLRGRAGRQGDPGSSQFFISLEDDLMRLFGGERIAAVMQRLKVPDGEPIQSPLVTRSVENAQKKVESNNFGVRKRLLEYDNVMNQQREVIYDRRKHALMGDRLRGEFMDYISEMAEDWYDTFHEEKNAEGFRNAVRTTLLSDISITDAEFDSLTKDSAVERVVAVGSDFYERKEETLGQEFMAMLERWAALRTIDESWREHLRSMDDLKEGIYLRAYGQKDPLLEYKQEAYKIFIELIREINRETVHTAFKYWPQQQQPSEEETRARQERQRQDQQRQRELLAQSNEGAVAAAVPSLRTTTASRALSFSHPSASSAYGTASDDSQQRSGTTVRKSGPDIGRNDPCWCGSGKKFKKCHGAVDGSVVD